MVSIQIDDDILLRTYCLSDVSDLFMAINESRTHLSRWLGWVEGTTMEEHTLQFIQQTIHRLEVQEELSVGIWLNNKIIGGIAMLKWEHNCKRAQIGYWIAKEYEGKGIMKKCLTKFIDYIFYKIGLNKLEIQFVAANKRSANVAVQLGFKIEGVIRQSYVRQGLIEDLVITGMLKEEWVLCHTNID